MFDQDKSKETDAEKVERARARGETIRTELVTLLQAGEATAADLLPQIRTPDVPLSEVAFQLDRLADENRAVGEGGVYRLPRSKA